MENSISKKNTKALIIAAGLGSRLKKHTENLPKCMLDFGGKTLLQRQLDAYKKNNIKNISLVRGYKKEKINYKGINYFENLDYRNNNILRFNSCKESRCPFNRRYNNNLISFFI